MPKKNIVSVDKRTGEELHGALVWMAPKHKVYTNGYVAISQKGLYELLIVYQVTTQQLYFIARILKDLGYRNVIPYTASEFSKIYHYSSAYACKIFKELSELGIIVPFMVSGRSQYYALNSNIGWKGKPKDWYDNTDLDSDIPGHQKVYYLKKTFQEYVDRMEG